MRRPIHAVVLTAGFVLGASTDLWADAPAEFTAEQAARLVEEGGGTMSAEESIALALNGGLSGQPQDDQVQVLRVPHAGDLAPEAAAALARFPGKMLQLDGLTHLSPETAAALAEFRNVESLIEFGGIELRNPWLCFLSLRGLDSLSREAAGQLAASEANLLLDDVTELTPEAAGALATHRGVLSLCGLRRLPADVARRLAEHRGQNLQLDGLTTLTADVAAALAPYRGSRLSLNGLVELPAETAVALAAYQGRLRLQGVKSLSVEAARALAASSASGLSLSGMTALPVVTAKALASFRGDLFLNGLVELSDEAARVLADCPGHVDLINLDPAMLSATAREALERHAAKTAARNVTTYCLGSPRLTIDLVPVVELIAAREGKAVVGAVEIDVADAVEIARRLGAIPHPVYLPELRRVSAPGLAALRESGTIVLPPEEALTVLAEPAAGPDEGPSSARTP